jgi:hypothetical protein
MPITEVQELFASELCAIVGDDDIGYPKPVNYVGEKEDSLLGANFYDGSIHLENLSMATSKWVYPPAAIWRGPTRLRPHTANGQVMGSSIERERGGGFAWRRIGTHGMNEQVR